MDSQCPGASRRYSCPPQPPSPDMELHNFEMICHPIPVYKPPPPIIPPKRKIIYCRGGGPCWKFHGGKYHDALLRQQEVALKRLKLIKAQRKHMDYYVTMGTHQEIMDRVGPDWYQELSPKQFKAAETLKKAIACDKRFKCTTHCQENIGVLGLVLRPNQKHIQMSLKYCCNDPVEFLLILYQLIKPHRKEYSLNDRLLLSAVVHLTIVDTLKELHKRIPSPPKCPPSPAKKSISRKRQKRNKINSPYLEISTFKPAPRPNTGKIYRNERTQYPESPYFSYLPELRKMQGSAPEYTPENYWTFVLEDSRRKNKALNPRQKLELDLIKETMSAQKVYDKLTPVPPAPRLLKPSVYEECFEVYSDEAVVPDGGKVDGNLNMKVNITAEYDSENNPTSKTCKVTVTLDGSGNPTENLENVAESQATICTSDNTNALADVSIQQADLTPQDRAVGIGTKVVESLVQTEEVTHQEQREGPDECVCKTEVLKRAHEAVCECDKCKEDRLAREAKQKLTRVIAGLAVDKAEGDHVRVIEGTKPRETCNCLEKYLEQIRKYEEMKRRIDASHKLKRLDDKYVIGGVSVDGEDQPSYKLDGAVVKRECKCVEMYRKYLEHQEYLKNRAQIPKGRQQYVISGVKESPEGNVFILSQAVAMDDCHCMKIYKHYEKVHHDCMDIYNTYLKKIEEDKAAYMAEVEADPRFLGDAKEKEGDTVSDVEHTDKVDNTEDTVAVEQEQHTFSTEIPQDEVEEVSSVAPIDSENLACEQDVDENDEVCPCLGEPFKTETNISLTVDMRCICGPEEEDHESVCNCEDDVRESSTMIDTDLEQPITRFLILDKVPRRYKDHLEILSKALSVMANDGYPLAKLPNCHLLPHFKLWMQLRCGKFWTMRERQQMLRISEFYWRHTTLCSRKAKVTPLDIPAQELSNYTWRQAPAIKRMAAIKNTNYYSVVKQNAIGDGREFYPTTFSYEFPTVGFRDCFFAYTAAKEEECYAYHPWMEHERKEPARLKQNKC